MFSILNHEGLFLSILMIKFIKKMFEFLNTYKELHFKYVFSILEFKRKLIKAIMESLFPRQ